jgi:hypothetical protein
MDPLRIALLTSQRATGIERLLADPNRGSTWELALISDSDGAIEQTGVDYILLDGDESILSEAVTARFAGKILAIHETDRSVRAAILGGAGETRAAIRLVTRDAAHRPLFLLGPRYPVAPMALDAHERGDVDFLDTYAELHRQWMRTTCWGEMLARTLELLAGGTMQVIGDVVWIDGAPAPCRMGEAPDACHDPEAMVARGIPRSCPFIG